MTAQLSVSAADDEARYSCSVCSTEYGVFNAVIQSYMTVAGNKYGKKYRENNTKLECGPMPNVMAALPNIGGALCSTPQSLANAHY